MAHAHRLGRWGEWWGELYLRRAGFQILARNLVTPYAEIDRVALERHWLVICEIKTRRTEPERWLESSQEGRLLRAAEWLHRKHGRRGTAVRVDLVRVRFRIARSRFDFLAKIPSVSHERAVASRVGESS